MVTENRDPWAKQPGQLANLL